ncbi:MAG: hypothetical protein IJG16_07695, partial [Clostridia bacterium]|nr:hypothetical protein [Clostridia bacterium]
HETVPGQTLADAYQIGIDAAAASLENPPSTWSGSDKREVSNRKTAYEARLAALTEAEKAETWGTSFGDVNDKTHVGSGAGYQWNTKDFNEPEIGLVYDAYLHVTGSVYQTLPLYNNLKTTGNYIYADNFDIKGKTATLHVDAEVRNESSGSKNLTLEVNVVDPDGKLRWSFESAAAEVAAASDKGDTFETVVDPSVYSSEKIANAVGITGTETVKVTHITAEYDATGVRFWNIDDPYMYDVYTILKDGNTVIDVQKKTTGFRKIVYTEDDGLEINDRTAWLPGYAQRATDEWAVIGSANDWINDYDMKLLKDSNSDFIRWMHVAPKPAEVRASDKYGVAIACPAGDKEGKAPDGRQWSQRVEAMRDVMIYFRNSPSVVFWETGNSQMGTAAKANEMAAMRNKLDPKGMRFIGARSTQSAAELNYDYNYAGTMLHNYEGSAREAMAQNGKFGPIMETEYNREEAPRRVWDDYSPPDYDYVNKYTAASKIDGGDYWDLTQEDLSLSAVKSYAGFYNSRVGGSNGNNYYSAIAMMVWSDSIMHNRNAGSENCRTSGRVDPVRQIKDSYNAVAAAQSDTPAVDIVGHWSYPAKTTSNYKYYDKFSTKTGSIGSKANSYFEYNTAAQKQRDPEHKTVYVIGSADVAKVELRVKTEGGEDVIYTNDTPRDTFIYEFPGVDVTKGDSVKAIAYDVRGSEITTDEIRRTYEAYQLVLKPVKSDDGWKADGADIMFFDIEVQDRNGNVCALNYDKINLSYEGTQYGTYLGGYNGGLGIGSFQSSTASEGLSHYFGGTKTAEGFTNLGANYVYAENGTNRIFVKSTRNAGEFKLTATLCDANGEETAIKGTASVTSKAVTTTGGLTTEMPARQNITYAEKAPEIESAASMVSLSNTFNVNWNELTEYVKPDNTVYYTIKFNDEVMNLPVRAYEGLNNSVFAPVKPILDALKGLGADIEYTINIPEDPEAAATLEVIIDGGTSAGGHTLSCNTGQNELFVDGDKDLPDDFPTVKDGNFCFQIAMLLNYISGVETSTDSDGHIYSISYEGAAPSTEVSIVVTPITEGEKAAKVTVKNAPDNTVIYAAKYDGGKLTNIAEVHSGDELDFMPDKVFLWEKPMTPVKLWTRTTDNN